MEVQKYNLKTCRELAKSVGWECLSTKYIDAKSKLTWKCPEGHVQEITTQYFKFMVTNGDRKCVFCHGIIRRRISLHWLIQGLCHHGLEKELFQELIQEAQERYDKEIENIEKSWEVRLEKLVEIGIREAKARLDEQRGKLNKYGITLKNIRNQGIKDGIRIGVQNSKYLWNNTEELKKKTNIPHEEVLMEMLINELYVKILKQEE